ncbi:imidazoleglycerol-phosphate dehydratase HisB [Sulfurospirillum arcachonense]|uniref:imidazoleglycerol-phosphate dehydratase HisB n=1 Tax=Sulfurospirillum arcachonense TaxID=57666 RepID=UPI00046AF3D6|nr:imidazoleglycerol-phosphate dehydratase HisB [Sulfurospirillum arcachonense]
MITRTTKETDISVELNLYGTGISNISTGIGFFDHMLEAFSKHSLIDLDITCKGDTHIDFHHSVEDVGIVLGQALKKAIYPIQNVERYSNAVVVMDEAAVESCLDLSNRAYLVYDVSLNGKVGEFDVELAEEFFRAVVTSAGLTLHVECKRGKNKHHILEAAFKSFAVALRRSIVKNDRVGIPSTKGIL